MPITNLSLDKIEAFRAQTFRLQPALRITSETQALEFINDIGFLFLWMAGEQLNFPSLSGSYSSPSGGWAWWDWKQTLPNQKACFYAKILRHKGTFISWSYFPYFYAVYGERLDIETRWEAGTLNRSHKKILDILAGAPKGGLTTREIRMAYGPTGKKNTQTVRRVLEELQRNFRVCPAGGDTEGWTHHNWELAERWVQAKYLRKGRQLDPSQAGAAILTRYLQTVGTASLAEIGWLFSWSKETIQDFLRPVRGLEEVEITGVKGRYFALRSVLQKM
jgi:hypothetical protein